MVRVSVVVDNREDKVESNLDPSQASLADLAIAGKILKRYLSQIDKEMDNLIDRDTDKEGVKRDL